MEQESIVFNGEKQFISQHVDVGFSGKLGCVVDWFSFSFDVSPFKWYSLDGTFVHSFFLSAGFPSDISLAYMRRNTGVKLKEGRISIEQ